MRLGLIMTWVPLYCSTKFQFNNSPLWALFVKLVLQITLLPLNRFPRFKLRWIPLENTFLTTYHTSRYVQGILRVSM